MTWDSTEVSAITIGRLMASPPEQVYEELRDYAAFHIADEGLKDVDDDLEKALLGRADRLINLSLAQFGGSASVVRLLYTQAMAGTGNQTQDRAIRLACLANQIWPDGFTPTDKVLDDAEIRRLVTDGDEGEVRCLLANPSQRKLLGNLFTQEPPFNDLPTERLAKLVVTATGNPALTKDDSNRFGPDLTAWHIHKGIYRLIAAVPVEKRWSRTLAYLLYKVGTRSATLPDTDPQIVFNRWKALPREERKTRDQGDPRGHWTHSMEPRDEFLCLMAALFGAWSAPETKGVTYLGSLNDPDELMRYAFYGHGNLSVEQMADANRRDGDGFVLAALYNTGLLWKVETRAKLEECIRGHVRHLYRHRCEELHAQYPKFDPKPVSKHGKDLLDDVIEDKPNEELERLTSLESSVSLLQQQMIKLQGYAGWMIAILVAIALIVLIRR